MVLKILLTELSTILQNLKKLDAKYKSVVNLKCAECLTDRTFLDKVNDKYDLEQLVKHFFSLLMYFIKEHRELLSKV